MKNKLAKLVLIPMIVGSLSSCNSQSRYIRKEKTINGFVMVAFNDAVGNHFSMYKKSDSQKSNMPKLVGNDFYGTGKKPDGRFDDIRLIDVPKGHPLEKYANFDSISKYFKEVKETGEDVK